MASQVYNGSICLTDLIAHCKAGHSAFVKGKNGKIYANYTEWVNDESNQFGQHTSILLNSHKDKRMEEGKVYIGNGKKGESTQEAPSADDMADLSLDGVDVPPVDAKGIGPTDPLPF